MGRDAITGLVVLAASLALFWATLGLERHPLVPVGPDFYPRIVLAITAALALCLVAVDVVAHRRGRAAPAAPRKARNYALVAVSFGIFAVYVLALPYLGFRIATFVFVAVMQVFLERPANPRRWIIVIALAFAAALATYLVFESYLQVLLPRGRWTDF